MKILETERLILREIEESDDAFMLDLLNQPSFIKYIGDRNVRALDEAREFIESRYRKSYAENGFGLYAVELKLQNPDAARAVMEYGRKELGLKRVLAITTQDNESSGRLLEKLGFKYDGLITQPNDAEELKLFSSETE
jgi:RimJ/RimL family protein N-acetyltransferase